MSYLQLTYHIIFATWCREQVINIGHERELYMFIFNFANKRGVKVWRIGGMPDHIHILCDIPARIAVSDFIRILKSESSKFLRINRNFPLWRKWSNGYACVSIDYSLKETRINYIKNQKIHHIHKSFVEEYQEFVLQNGITTNGDILGDDTNAIENC